MAEWFGDVAARTLAEAKRIRLEREMTNPDDTKSVWEQMSPYKHVEIKRPNSPKPDDIPQDVWDIATSAYFGAWNAHDEMFNPASNSISDGLSLRFIEGSARAIMAEREACIADAAPYAQGNDIIAAIRKRGANNS